VPAQLRRGDPAAEIEQLHDRLGSFIQTFFNDPFGTVTAAAAPVLTPPIDVEETEDGYVVDVDLPNVRAEDLTVELRDTDELRISGRYEERERTGAMRRQSRRTGEFEYLVTLPGDVDPEQIDATLQNGVLTVRLRRSQGGQSRRIEVHGPDGGTTASGDGSRDGSTTNARNAARSQNAA
jgi:HSP20 family protein